MGCWVSLTFTKLRNQNIFYSQNHIFTNFIITHYFIVNKTYVLPAGSGVVEMYLTAGGPSPTPFLIVTLIE